MSQPDFPLEPDRAAMRAMLDATIARVLEHIEALPEMPASNVEGALERALELVEPLPEEGRPLEEILDFLFTEAIPRSFNSAGPGYLAYIPGGGLFHTALADLIADTTNRYTGVAAPAPLLTRIEANAVGWLSRMVGYPEGAGGILTSGGSMATFSAVVTARRDRLGDDLSRGTLYASEQTHHALLKAAALAGFPTANLRLIPVDAATFRMRRELLKRRIEEDRAQGFKPFLLVGNAGTVNTGTVDDLEALAGIARRQNLWYHVDGAYGGFFVLTERGRRALAGIELADSVVLDPHKGLFLPYGTGALLVRDRHRLRAAHAFGADYLPALPDDSELVNWSDLSPELSRPFRGLRLWLPLKLLGLQPFRQALDEKLDLARLAAQRLQSMDGVELLAAPQLSSFAFRLRGADMEEADLDALHDRLLEHVHAAGHIMLNSTRIGGRRAIHLCILSFRTHRDRVLQGLQDIAAAVAALRAV